MGIISLEQKDSILWLGRYTERVYTTIRFFAPYFDQMIDGQEDVHKDFCARLEIPDIYKDKKDFLERYCFDRSNPDSIASNLMRAYDNAIVLREMLGTETLCYVQLAYYEMQRAAVSDAPMMELQKVMDNIVAFWGSADDSIDDVQVRDILVTGRRIERVDLYARLRVGREEIRRFVMRLSARLKRSGLPYPPEQLEKMLMDASLPEPDYSSIIRAVESLFV
jgi:uncharacterized alpha-E superfamily protein